jgi:hypothetical protein
MLALWTYKIRARTDVGVYEMEVIMLGETRSYKVKKLASSQPLTAKKITSVDKELLGEAVENQKVWATSISG